MRHAKRFLAALTAVAILAGFAIPGGRVSAAAPRRAPLIVLAGGGTEGELGDEAAWSARLYRHLLDRGDVNGDGRVVVAVISAHAESDFIPGYFKSLGAHEAFNLTVDTRAAAASSATLAQLERADAVFIKGGDQGKYYDLWNDSPLEAALRRLADRGGAIGGTSAGAMSLAEIAFAGGKSLTSPEVLTDACTPMLDDQDGGSGIHTDFFGFVAGATIDTHFTERARLGRMLGVMARAAGEHRKSHLLGIGLSERTGVVIDDGIARVIGLESVWFVEPAPSAVAFRKAGSPLAYGPLDAHILVDGWSYDLVKRRPVRSASATQGTDAASHLPESGALALSGGDLASERAFDFHVARTGPFAVIASDAPVRIHDAIGVADAHADATRGRLQESLVRALYDRPGTTGFLLASGTGLARTAENPRRLTFGAAPGAPVAPEVACIALSVPATSWRSLSPYVSTMDAGDGSLHAAALTDVTIRVLAATVQSGAAFEILER